MGAPAASPDIRTQNQQQAERVVAKLEKLKREDCIFVKHDDRFTCWKILVGPSDWKDHSAGKEGVDRYQLHNLPSTNSGSGVYELGIVRPTVLVRGKKVRKLREKDVMVVYIGKAENIRQRLQRYGQTGSHLERAKSSISTAGEDSKPLKPRNSKNGNAPSSAVINSSEATPILGPRLLSTAFDHGYSMAFRWASAENNEAAEKVESQLLKVFDYAWNKDANGARRPHEILAKLAMENQASTLCGGNSVVFARRNWLFYGKDKAGIDLDVRKPLEPHNYESGTDKNRPANFMLFSRNRPRLVSSAIEGKVSDPQILKCGVMLENGQACTVAPKKGRKRCEAHKGMRVVVKSYATTLPVSTNHLLPSINGTKNIEIRLSMEDIVTQEVHDTPLQNSLDYSSIPAHTDKELNAHKGLHLCSLKNLCFIGMPNTDKQSSCSTKLEQTKDSVGGDSSKLVCGIIQANGSKCLEIPPNGRKRCPVHKGMQLSSSLHESGDAAIIKEKPKPQT